MRDLSEKQMENIAAAVLEVYRKQAETEKKQEQDRRLRNTKLLLKNYQTFKKYAETAVGHEEPEEVDIRELILNGEDLVRSIRQTTSRTLIMIKHMDKAMDALKYICEQEEKEQLPTGKHYEILKMRFIEGRAISEIADEYHLNVRSVYKAIDAGAERLSVMLFGVYGLTIS